MKRLAQRGEHSPRLKPRGVPGEQDTLVDTALYLAASHENARAAALVRRERLGLAALVGGLAACIALAWKAWA